MSEFFDVPVISIRNFLLPHLILHRDQTTNFFAADDTGGIDLVRPPPSLQKFR